MDPKKYPSLAVTLYLGNWSGRYSRRKQVLAGEYGVLQDQIAVQTLLEKNRALDRAVSSSADWEPTAREWIEIYYRNPHNGIDASSPDSPHSYGPSLRRLWVETRQRGASQQDAWEAVESWANHQPEAWNKKYRGMDKKIQEALERPVSWKSTGNLDFPWEAAVEGQTWQVGLNDFPDEMMYRLVIQGEVVGDFHDWPKLWQRG